jgi:hypothetical protein
MDLLCRAGRHSKPTDEPVWNNGYWFSSCRRCGCDLVRRGGGRWRVPPKGYQVVWKPRLRGQINWNGLIAVRPERAANDTAPAIEPGFHGGAAPDAAGSPEPLTASPRAAQTEHLHA